MSQNLIPPSSSALSASIEGYLRLSVAENTSRAYKADLEHFYAWGGSIPAVPETIAAYLAAHAGLLSVATLTRRLAAISKKHTVQGLPTPTSAELVKLTMRGIKRQHGKPQKQAAPLCRDDLILVLNAIPDDLGGCRDKAVLLIGFCAALRRSELCVVKHEDIQFTAEGLILTVPRSKTDQKGEGRKIGIPHGRGKVCPIQTLQGWLTRSGITGGCLFRAIDRGRVADSHLSDRSICNIVKSRVGLVGLLPELYSGHSLRSGLATSAAQQGYSSWEIRRQTGHKSDGMLARYIREGSLFRNNAAALF
ncbi:MAG: tyrosine-type recombinase/integrase [Micavibrio sp.]|nr:tyrosine-type recombinase/integrase [Micavibrio sp.]